MRQVEVDLLSHGSLQQWNPQIGDTIFKDGVLFRWCGVVEGIKGDNVSIRKAGNIQFLTIGDYKTEVISARSIKQASVGSYFVCSDGTYYV